MEIEITHGTIQMLVITPVVPQSHHFQTLRRHGNGCFSQATVTAEIIQFFVATQQENMSQRFQGNKRKLPVHMPFHVAVSYVVMIRSFMIVCAAMLYQTCENSKKGRLNTTQAV